MTLTDRNRFFSDALTGTRDNWLTEMLGVESWNVTSRDDSKARLGLEFIPPATKHAFLTAKVAVRDIQSVSRLTQMGFYFVDTTLTLQCEPRRALESVPANLPHESITEVCAASSEESDSIASIAAVALATSRFHLDPGISSATACFVKSEWAKNLALGLRGNGCRVIRDADGVAGFLGIVEGKGAESILAIDLIAVRPEVQGLGIGSALVRDFLEIAQAHGALAQVGTQIANTAAVRFYERLGFTLTKAEYVMHAHVPTKDPS